MKLIVKLILLFLFSAEANINIYFGISMVFDTDQGNRTKFSIKNMFCSTKH